MFASELESIANLHTERKVRRQSGLEMLEDDYGDDSSADSICYERDSIKAPGL